MRTPAPMSFACRSIRRRPSTPILPPILPRRCGDGLTPTLRATLWARR